MHVYLEGTASLHSLSLPRLDPPRNYLAGPF